jgi:hypothetical protein
MRASLLLLWTEQLENLLSAEGLLPVSVHSIQKDIESDKLVYIIDERGIEMGMCKERGWCKKREKLIRKKEWQGLSAHTYDCWLGSSLSNSPNGFQWILQDRRF